MEKTINSTRLSNKNTAMATNLQIDELEIISVNSEKLSSNTLPD